MAAVAAAAVAGQLAGSLLKARSAKKKRKQDAKNKQAEIITNVGSKQSDAIGSIISNFRKTLVG